MQLQTTDPIPFLIATHSDRTADWTVLFLEQFWHLVQSVLVSDQPRIFVMSRYVFVVGAHTLASAHRPFLDTPCPTSLPVVHTGAPTDQLLRGSHCHSVQTKKTYCSSFRRPAAPTHRNHTLAFPRQLENIRTKSLLTFVFTLSAADTIGLVWVLLSNSTSTTIASFCLLESRAPPTPTSCAEFRPNRGTNIVQTFPVRCR